MNFIERIKLIERVDGLIRRAATGSPKELAFRLNMSERNIYELIKIMKAMGAPIYYCNSKGSYRYQFEIKLSLGFLNNSNQLMSVQGGIKRVFFAEKILLQN